MKLSIDRLVVGTALVVAAGGVAAFAAPPDRLQGELQRLMYIHVPAAWAAYLSFGLVLVGSVGWLWRRDVRFDRLALAAAETGVFFTGLTILLGAVWGKPVWGVWWTWDPRLVTTALMFFIYMGYLGLRRATVDRTGRSRRAAVFGVVAFAQVPIVHFSVLWWRTLHQPPTVLRPADPSIDHTMLATLLVNVIGFTLLGALMLRARMRLAKLDDALEEALGNADRTLAGQSVDEPRLRSRDARV